jgi:hypothetical protein
MARIVLISLKITAEEQTLDLNIAVNAPGIRRLDLLWTEKRKKQNFRLSGNICMLS